jgi:hypothetical protein
LVAFSFHSSSGQDLVGMHTSIYIFIPTAGILLVSEPSRLKVSSKRCYGVLGHYNTSLATSRCVENSQNKYTAKALGLAQARPGQALGEGSGLGLTF